MEPLTKIDLNNCKWYGLLAIACTLAAELLAIASTPDGQRNTFTARERVRRSIQRSQVRKR